MSTGSPIFEILEGRPATVGAVPVHRLLPQRGRRTVGAWCFADHFGPFPATEHRGLDVGPHPHLGLQTVTWLLDGEVLHRDSLGSEHLIRPGQLNVMTAGSGVAHSEEATGRYRGPLRGLQLWVAQPDATRWGPATFEHHDDLPRVELGATTLTVLTGSLAGATSPARADTPLVGAEATIRVGSTTWPLDPAFEHGLLVLDGSLAVEGSVVGPLQLAVLGAGRDVLELESDAEARALLLGGEPFAEPLFMWWNFVGRTAGEVRDAVTQWNDRDPRFGEVASPLERIAAPLPHRLENRST